MAPPPSVKVDTIPERDHRALALRRIFNSRPPDLDVLEPLQRPRPTAHPDPVTPREFDPPPRTWEQLSDQEKRKQTHDIFRRAFALPNMSLSSTNTQRTLVAWRIIRRMADGFSAQLDFDEEDPIERMVFHPIYQNQGVCSEHFQGGVFRKDPFWLDVQRAKVPLTIGPPPASAIESRQLWLRVVQRIAQELSVGEDDTEVDHVRLVKRHMLTEEHLDDAWPSQHFLLVFERLIVSQTVELFVQHGAWHVTQWLRNRFGFAPQEIKGLLAQARVQIKTYTSDDQDLQRAVVDMQLDRVIDKSVDDRIKLSALRMKMQLYDLGRSEEDPEMNDMLSAIRSANQAAVSGDIEAEFEKL